MKDKGAVEQNWKVPRLLVLERTGRDRRERTVHRLVSRSGPGDQTHVQLEVQVEFVHQ